MRILLLCLCLIASPVAAWEFAPTPVCTLSDDGAPTRAEITYDGQTYTLTATHPDGWPDAPVFAIQFVPNGPFISTTQHQIDGTDLRVSDRGFGNVLAGLENNLAAILHLGDLKRMIALDGAAEPVAAFRACQPPVATS